MKVSKHVEQLLRQGRKLKELVQLGFSKSVVTRVRRQLREEKATPEKEVPEGAPQVETQLQTPPELPEKITTIWQKLQSTANDLQRIDSVIQALSEVTIVIAAGRELGPYRYEICPYQKDDLCRRQTWSSQGEIHQAIGEPVVEDKASDSPLYGARYQITCNTCR